VDFASLRGDASNVYKWLARPPDVACQRRIVSSATDAAPFLSNRNWSLVVGDAQVGGGGAVRCAELLV